jgi:geranylgeranyl pyrophosphate synthase
MQCALVLEMNSTTTIHSCLRALIDAAGIDRDYARAMHAVVDGAERSEQAGMPLAALPLLCAAATGARSDVALPVATSFRALQIALKLLDDVEDGDVARLTADPRAPARVINLSTGFLTLAGVALDDLRSATRSIVQRDQHQMLLRMGGGQHAGFRNRLSLDRAAYMAIMEAKSAILFEWSARAGALCTSDSLGAIELLAYFGHAAGMVLQLGDDLLDFRMAGSEGDLASGQPCFPLYYALEVGTSTDQAYLRDLLERAPTDPEAEQCCRARIRELGGEMALHAERMRYHRKARSALIAATLRGLNTAGLRAWLRQLSGTLS